MKHFRAPNALEAGAHVALVAPAGPLPKPEDLPRAQDNARSLGWEPIVGAHATERLGYLAGHDRDRLNDINRAIRDPKIDAVWILRGGYGLMRILPGIDYDALSRTPKAIIGFSDLMGREIFGPLGHARYADYAAHIKDSGDALLKSRKWNATDSCTIATTGV